MKLGSPKRLIHVRPVKIIDTAQRETPASKIQCAGGLSGQRTGTSNPSTLVPWKEILFPKWTSWHTLPHTRLQHRFHFPFLCPQIRCLIAATALGESDVKECPASLTMSNRDDQRPEETSELKEKLGQKSQEKTNKQNKLKMKHDPGFKTRFQTDLHRAVHIRPLGPTC